MSKKFTLFLKLFFGSIITLIWSLKVINLISYLGSSQGTGTSYNSGIVAGSLLGNIVILGLGVWLLISFYKQFKRK
jgi:hypothetical protein